ncbi:MAG TPA: hypothetical protein VGK02_06300 [Candidatus Aquicultor sp.]|jgi:hypothetical protein
MADFTIEHHLEGQYEMVKAYYEGASRHFYAMMLSSAYGKSTTANGTVSSISGNELDPAVVGNWYTKGGMLLSNMTVDKYNNRVRAVLPAFAFNNATFSNMRYIVVVEARGVATGGFPYDPGLSIVHGILDYQEKKADSGLAWGVVFSSDGYYNLGVSASTDRKPTLSLANFSITGITQGGYLAKYVGAASVTDPDNAGASIYFEMCQGSTSNPANIVGDGAGTTLFTGTEINSTGSGVFIVKANSAGQVTVSLRAISAESGAGAYITKTITIPANQPPTVPTGLYDYNKTINSCAIGFTGSSDIDGYVRTYRLYSNSVNDASTATQYLANTGGTLGSPPSTVFNVSAQTPGSTVYFWVTAVDDTDNESVKSAVLVINFPTNMPPSVVPANILIASASATTPGTVDSVNIKIGAISNADILKTIRIGFFKNTELLDKDAAYATALSEGRAFELVVGVGDAAITAIQGGSGYTKTALGLIHDTTYTPSAKIEETKSEGGTQWGNWVPAAATIAYISPTETLASVMVNSPTAVTIQGTISNPDGPNVTKLKSSIGAATIADNDPTNIGCIQQEFTGLNIANGGSFTIQATGLTISGVNQYKAWVDGLDTIAGYGAWTPTPITFAHTAPTAPVLGTPTVGSTTLQVAVTTATTLSDSATLSAYNWYKRETGQSIWVSDGTGSAPHTFSGLTNGASYDLCCEAVDNYSAISAKSTAVVATPGVETLDANYWAAGTRGANGVIGPTSGSGYRERAVKFTCGKTGKLSKVDIPVYYYQGTAANLVAEIRADSSGTPGPVIGSGTTIPSFTSPIDEAGGISSPRTAVISGASVTNGQVYWVSLRVPSGDTFYGWVNNIGTAVGVNYTRTTTNGSWAEDAAQDPLLFKTYVTG